VLACKEEATRLPDLLAGAFAEMKAATADLENALRQALAHSFTMDAAVACAVRTRSGMENT
jgi:hypothetical protein